MKNHSDTQSRKLILQTRDKEQVDMEGDGEPLGSDSCIPTHSAWNTAGAWLFVHSSFTHLKIDFVFFF